MSAGPPVWVRFPVSAGPLVSVRWSERVPYTEPLRRPTRPTRLGGPLGSAAHSARWSGQVLSAEPARGTEPRARPPGGAYAPPGGRGGAGADEPQGAYGNVSLKLLM
ncbi:hypothetical protein SSP531S_30710 [Streptomyces spongiicola]|uniref:Uncharacterized protein n=1 Tax=Streptomyces spongiicola TaxID=1690221 RepID=A0A388T0I2_9ACTN|nr:hypothetical protein SSP531S_30710 [Streptomyces spongiicola]